MAEDGRMAAIMRKGTPRVTLRWQMGIFERASRLRARVQRGKEAEIMVVCLPD